MEPNFQVSGSAGGWIRDGLVPKPGSRILDPGLPHCGWVPDPGHVGLKMASCWLEVDLETPKMASRGLQDISKMASGRPQDDLKIDIFEVFVRKARKCVWSYYSNVLLIFWEVSFHRFWSKILSIFCKFWAVLPHMPQEASRWPQDGPTWRSGGNLGPS